MSTASAPPPFPSGPRSSDPSSSGPFSPAATATATSSGVPARSLLRVKEPRDAIALVPYQLGFVPERSLVLVSLRGRRSRVGLVLRVDLPDRDELRAPLADQVARHMRDDGAAMALVVVYSDSTGDEQRELVLQVRSALERYDIAMGDGWHVGPVRYRSLYCAEPSCCPPQGWPVTDLQASRVSAEMVALGVGVAPNRSALLPDLDPLPDDVLQVVERVAAAAVAGTGPSWRLAGLSAWSELVDEVKRRRDGPSTPGFPKLGARPEMAAAEPTEHQRLVGTVLARMSDPWVRDAMLLTAVPGAGDVPVALASEGPHEAALAVLDRVFGSDTPQAPDADLLAVHQEALADLVRHAAGARRAAPLAVMAWASWWDGNGAAAAQLAEAALLADPANSLARLVDGAVQAAMAPAWAARARHDDLASRS